MKPYFRSSVLAVAAIALTCGTSFAQEQQQDRDKQKTQRLNTQQDSKATEKGKSDQDRLIAGAITTYASGLRASNIIGMEVRNEKNEELGTVNDLVMDRWGQVRYAAMSRGGVLGIGDKLFALPFCCVEMRQDKDDPDERYLLANIDVDTLKNSPGFDQDDWPSIASETTYWLAVDDHYKEDIKRGQKKQKQEKKAAKKTSGEKKDRDAA